MDKHILNDPSTLVVDSLKGLARFDEKVALDVDSRVAYLKSPLPGTVSLISGGGAGHEPAHSGWVTPGMLTGAITGNIFASPTVKQIKQGIALAGSSAGTLILVKNYTGDVLHFGLAKEHHAATRQGQGQGGGDARFVIVGDDVAVPRSQSVLVGRRGLAGTVLVYKIAGALAARGESIDRVEQAAKLVSENIGTVGVGLGHCHVPGTSSESSTNLAADEAEIGMGIHNEPGFQRVKPIPARAELVNQMVKLIVATDDKERSFLNFGEGRDEVVLMVNNLGGMSELELGAVAGEAVDCLESQHKIVVRKVLVGTYMTSLNMPGFSLTLLLLPRPSTSASPPPFSAEDLLKLIDEKSTGSKWPGGAENQSVLTSAKQTLAGAVSSAVSAAAAAGVSTGFAAEAETGGGRTNVPVADPKAFLDALKAACDNLIKSEPEITRYDTVAGDGDCGLTLKAGAEAVLRAIETGVLDGTDAVHSILVVAESVEEAMGGTSGALYSIFLNSLASSLSSYSASSSTPAAIPGQEGGQVLSSELMSKSLSAALDRLYTYTLARPPSRTLVNPLSAFITTLASMSKEPPHLFNAKVALTKAEEAADETKGMKGTAGRAAYVSAEGLEHEGVPDPGAVGVVEILKGIVGVLE